MNIKSLLYIFYSKRFLKLILGRVDIFFVVFRKSNTWRKKKNVDKRFLRKFKLCQYDIYSQNDRILSLEKNVLYIY